MGERLERWRTRLRSDRAENVSAVILVASFSLLIVVALAAWTPSLDWSTAFPAMATFVLGALVAGVAAAFLLLRWHSGWMRDVRRFGRSAHWGIVAMWLPVGTFLVVPFAPAFAESYVCERGGGILVQTSWTEESDEIKTGVYTHDGKTYDIRVSVDEWLVRQAAQEQPPTGDDPYYVRTYRVPWAGSGAVCGNAESSDKNDMVTLAAMAVVGATVAAAATRELVGRRRRR